MPIMAKKAKYDWGKSSNGRYQKFETRVALKMLGTASSEPYSDSAYIDVAQCLSIINQKLVRQGNVFKIKNMSIYSKDQSPTKTYKVGVIPRTWAFFNAYRKARAVWMSQAELAYKDIGTHNLPKWMDFKVFMDEGHFDNFLAGTDLLLPRDFDQNEGGTDHEWAYSSLHDNSATSDAYYLNVLGGHRTSSGWVDSSTSSAFVSAGIIFGYEESRGYKSINLDDTDNVQQSPDDLKYGPFGRISARGDDQIADIIDQHSVDGDAPPYSYNRLPGGPTNLPEATQVATGRVAELSQVTANPSLRTFEAPLGLIRVELDAASALSSDEVEIQFDTEIMGAI